MNRGPTCTHSGCVKPATSPVNGTKHAFCEEHFEQFLAGQYQQTQRDYMQALRYNQGKPPLHLLAGRWQEEVAAVMDYGAQKYEPNNWRKGGPWSQHTGSVLRHILAFLRGEDNDPESGRHHLAHAICGLFFVLEWVLEGKGEDDRYNKPE